jgi:hypothetical protein
MAGWLAPGLFVRPPEAENKKILREGLNRRPGQRIGRRIFNHSIGQFTAGTGRRHHREGVDPSEFQQVASVSCNFLHYQICPGAIQPLFCPFQK